MNPRGRYGMCGDDPKTTGHVDLIQRADLLASAVLTEDWQDATYQALVYRNLRIECVAEAGENAKKMTS